MNINTKPKSSATVFKNFHSSDFIHVVIVNISHESWNFIHFTMSDIYWSEECTHMFIHTNEAIIIILYYNNNF